MDSFERLIGPKPTKQFLDRSEASFNVWRKQRTAEERARHKEQRALSEASLNVIRRLAGEDPKLAAETKLMRSKAQAHARKILPLPPQPPRVAPRLSMGSISATFVPPYWSHQVYWSQKEGDETFHGTAEKKTGKISFTAAAGFSKRGLIEIDCAVGAHFQPPAGRGRLDIFASPVVSWDFLTFNILDTASVEGYVATYIGEYTLDGYFLSNQSLNQLTKLKSHGHNSHVPVAATSRADSHHLYKIGVVAGVSVEADGWHNFWGSSATASLHMFVPEFEIYYASSS